MENFDGLCCASPGSLEKTFACNIKQNKKMTNRVFNKTALSENE